MNTRRFSTHHVQYLYAFREFALSERIELSAYRVKVQSPTASPSSNAIQSKQAVASRFTELTTNANET